MTDAHTSHFPKGLSFYDYSKTFLNVLVEG